MKKHIFNFLLYLLLIGQSSSPAQNLVLNGDFEEGLNFWSMRGIVNISTELAYSGSKSFEVATDIYDYGYLYQQFSSPVTAFKTDFWIKPRSETYFTIFELVANWSLYNSQDTKLIARIEFKQNRIKFSSFDADTTINNVLELNYWNKITITTTEDGLIKTFYINDQLVCQLTPSYALPCETLILGDVSARDCFGWLFYDNISVTTTSTGINNDLILPDQYLLLQNYPNPCNPTTTIEYQLPIATDVKLEIYNSLGQHIRTLVDQAQPTGSYSTNWDGTDDFNQPVSSGVYLYQLKTKYFVRTNKLILIR